MYSRPDEFGGSLFSLAVSVMTDLIHHEPQSFRQLQEAGLPDAFLAAIKVCALQQCASLLRRHVRVGPWRCGRANNHLWFGAHSHTHTLACVHPTMMLLLLLQPPGWCGAVG